MKAFYRRILDRLFWTYRGFAWRIAVYVPSTLGDESIDNTPYVNDTLAKFSNLFGGASANRLTGAWLGESGLVLENTVIVYAYTPKLNDSVRHDVLAYAETLKDTLKQESVAVEFVKVTGGLYLL